MTRPLRVLMTVDAVGGVWQYAAELARALVPLGHDVVLALLGPPAGAARAREIAAIPGVTLVETGLPLDWLAGDEAAVRAAARAVAALAGEVGAGLVQLNQPALAAEPMPVPAVAVAHSCVATWWRAVEGGAMPADLAWQAGLTRAGLLAADQVVCPSHAFAAALRDAYGLRHVPAVVPNGRRAPATPAGPIHDFAFTAGRLWDRGKNLATLDRAAARLVVPVKAAGPLAGPNGERVAFDHLHAVGSLDEAALGACLAARPVFVSAARYEPFGLAVLEAALAGCPLVLADIPTFRELWGDAAILVAPDDAEGFAAAIDALIGDTDARLARGDLARRRAARFTPAATAAAMAGIYRAALSRRRAAA